MAGDVFGNVAESFATKLSGRDDELFTQRMVFSWLAGLQGLSITGNATSDHLDPVAHLAEILGGLKAESSFPKAVTQAEEVVSKTINDDSLSTLIDKMTKQVSERATEQVSKTVQELISSDAMAALISNQIKQALEEILPDQE